MKNTFLNIGLAVALVLLFIASIYLVPAVIVAGVLSIPLYFTSKIKSVRIISINLLILLISLFVIELFFVSFSVIENFRKKNNKQTFRVFDRSTKKEINDSKSYTQILHEELGYGPMVNTIINSKKIKKDEVFYDVNYTIDENGHRITTNNSFNKNLKKSILFFGCSFTYGDGVQDNESLPYLFNSKTNNKYNVYNFAFSGYGAHQMLAILDNNIEKKSIKNNEKVHYVFYQAILDHINRVAFSSYPKYVLDNKDEILFVRPEVQNFVETRKPKSLILLKLTSLNHQKQRADISNHERDLFIKVIRKSRDLVQQKYQAKFVVILWDLTKKNNQLVSENEYNLNYVVDGLKKEKIDYILVSSILDDYKNNSQQYTINGDGHPSPLAYKKIADYLTKNIIKQ